jgi:hypothetical protein
MVSSLSQPTQETRTLSSGLIIAGAYADKVRRTLFAQMRDYVKQDKEIAREVARASGELNAVLFRILVEELKVEKGDVVRVRINYNFDPSAKRIVWDYNSLSIEVFKRVPDEQVASVVREAVRTKISKYIEEFQRAPRAVEERMKEFEVKEKEVEEAAPPPTPPAPPTPPPPRPLDVRSIVASAVVLGETVDGGLLIKLVDRSDRSVGLASLTPSGDELVVDAILIHEGSAKRYLTRTRARLAEYDENPMRLIEDLAKTQPTDLSPQEAERLIREKMQSLM